MFLLSFVFSGVYSYTRTGEQARVSAAVPMNLNFQARLMQGSGAIVADGTYSIEFNLYTAQNGGSSIWSEAHPTVQIKNGYLSVYLGDIDNDLNTVDWSQQHWLTMNVNADGEMNPRLRLTSVPYAFRSSQADGITNGAGVLSANGIAQLAPSSVQAINTALAALRINQQGAGLLAQFQGDGADVFTIAKDGAVTSGGDGTFEGGTLNLGTATQSGGLIINDGDGETGTINTENLTAARTYSLPDASGEICISTGNCGGTGDISQNGNSFTSSLVIGTNDNYGVNLKTAGITRFTLDTNGDASLTGALTTGTGLTVTSGGMAVTGDSTITGTLNGLTGLTSSGTITLSDLGAGLVQTSAGGVISSGAVDRNDATFFTNALNISNGGTGANTFTTNGIIFGNGTDALQATAAGTGGQLLIANSSGVPTFVTMSGDASLSNTGLLTIAGGAVTNAKLENNSINLDFGTNLSGDANVALGGTLNIDFSVTPTFTSVTAGTFTGSGAVTLSSGGSAALTLDSASNTLVLADSTMQYTGSGLTVDVSNAGLSTFNIVNNNGTNAANLDVEGAIFAGTGNAFQVNADGDITSVFRQLDGISTANGGSGVGTSTSLTLTNGANFDVGNYVQMNSANCGGTGINPCYAKITAKSTNTLTVSPALRWTSGATVNEYHIPELGGTNTTNTLANRYGRGYFISGVATGNGTTFYNEDSIETSLTNFNLLNEGVTTLNIGGAATSINIGNSSTDISILGSLATSATETITAGGGLIVSSGGAIISGGVDNNSGGISETGALSGVTTISMNGAITAATSTNTINGLIINAGALTSVTGITFSSGSLNMNNGGITNSGSIAGVAGLTFTSGALDLANGGITNTGSIAGASTISASGAITAATATNTINGLVINSGALSSVGGITFSSGNLALGGGNITGVGSLGLSGAITGATATNTINGIVINSGALSSVTSISASGAITAATTTNTINGLVINSGALSSVTGMTFTSGNLALGGGNISGVGTLGLTGAITGATATNTINGLIISSGALSAVTTINASGAITAATATNTINNLVINSGALSSVTGITFSSGNLALGGGNISGVGTLGLTGAITGATATNTINGLIINAGALSGINGLTFTSGSLNLNNGGIINTGSIAGATTISASGLATLSGGATISGATINLNASSNSAVNIATGTSTGTVTIGGNNNSLVIDSTNFDLASTGALTLTGNLILSGDANEGISGGGLTDCDNGNSRLTWDTTTNKFGCNTMTTRSFIDTTADTLTDNNTTNYWDLAAENGNAFPNLTLSDSTNEIFGIATMEITQTAGSGDIESVAAIRRTNDGSVPACGSTQVGANLGVFTTTTNAQAGTSVTFIDTPGTTANPTRYTICSDAATNIPGGLGGNVAQVTRLRLTLFEVNNAADLAEVYPTKDTTISAGEVVSLDPEGRVAVGRSGRPYDNTAIGVVATNPALLIGGTDGEAPHGVAVALAGRVPVKVTATNGAIKKGDMLTSSHIPGVAMKATKAGAIIGVAMGDFSDTGVGAVTMFIQNGQNAGSLNGQDSKQLLAEFMAGKATAVASEDISSILTDRLGAALEIVTPKVIAQEIETDKIVAGIDGLNIESASGETLAKVDETGISTSSVLRLSSKGTLQNITGIEMLSGGASIIGGIDNNAGGINEAGAITGATTIDAQKLTVNANATDNMLELKKDSKGVFTVFNNGALELRLDSANSFAVKDGSGLSMFNIDTINGIVKIGAGDNAKTVLFQLDAKVDSPQDPIGGTNGASYYNTKLERFRCYQDNRWTDCLPIGNLTDPIAMNRTIWSSMPSAESEYPGEPRILPDLTMAHEFKLRMRVTTPSAANATCRLQFAMNDDGPWADLMEGGSGELKVDKAGTLTTDWLKIKEDAQKEVVLRVMCKGGNGSASPVFYGVSVQLR